MARQKVAYRKKTQNRLAMVLVICVVLMLAVVVFVKCLELNEKQRAYAAREAELIEQIQAEEMRKQDIAEYEKYTHTMKYIEDIAKDRLGLVYEGEIVFKEEN